MKFFAGSSNKALAEKIAQHLVVNIAKAELIRFDDGELKPVIIENVRDEVCFVLQTTSSCPNDFWIELFLMVDALKREAARKVICIIPNFGYARQNQQHKKGEPVSAQVMVHFLEKVGVSEVITVDLHDETMTGMFAVPITNISALPILASSLKPYLPSNFVVVAPDQGGIERARLFAESIGCKKSIVTVEKKRELDKTHKSQAIQVLGEVRGLTTVIQDDVITSGVTILNAVEAIMSEGAKEVFVCITHQDFSPNVASKLQKSLIKKVLVTNSVATPPEKMFPKLEIIDISNLLAQEIQKIILNY